MTVKKVKVLENETKPMDIADLADTYVQNGDEGKPNGTALVNFSGDDVLLLKGNDGSGMRCRSIFLVFDLSAVKDRKPTDVSLLLQCVSAEKPTDISVYEVNPAVLDVTKVTYASVPENGALVASVKGVGAGLISINMTEWISGKLATGVNRVALRLVGTDIEPHRLTIAASGNPDANGPTLRFYYGEGAFVTQIGDAGVQAQKVWDRAAVMVEEWLASWKKTMARPDEDIAFVGDRKEEYPLTVKATRSPKNPYTDFPTRAIETIPGFKETKGETYDEYGGVTGRGQGKKTGWFHVEKENGRFRVIDPLGNPFYRMAVVSINPGNSDKQCAAVAAKHGDNTTWAKDTTAHLRDDLYFNSLGGWSSLDLLSSVEKPMALTSIVYYLSNYTRERGTNISRGGSSTFAGGVLPVFDPEFEEYCDARAAKAVAPYANDRHFYGWMSDNELHAEARLLDNALMSNSSDPTFAYTYATAWTFLRTMAGKDKVSIDDVTDEYRKLFRAMVYDRYLHLTSAATKKYAPNHMFLGCRFLPGCYRDEYVERVAGNYCDVISLNYYGAWTPDSDLCRDIAKWSGVPFIVTEWYAKGMDVCTPETGLTNESGAGWTCPTQKDRAAFYQNYALKLIECPGCVGFDWFKCWDNDPENLKVDLSNRNSNKGIFSTKYEEYTEVTSRMALLNKNVYQLIEFFDKRR